MRIAIVKAARDDEAGVWYVEASDLHGLHVEGETFEAFCHNVAGAVADLLEGEGGRRGRPSRSNQFDQTLAAFERRQHVGQGRFEPREEFASPRVREF